MAACGADRPDGSSLRGIARVIRPSERCAAPFLHVNAEMLLVPSVQPDGISRLEEDSPDACDSLHLSLRDVTETGAYRNLPAARSHQPFVRRRMRVSITIKKSPYHPLILRAMEARLSFEEIDASFRKRDRDLLRILTKYQLTGWRKKI